MDNQKFCPNCGAKLSADASVCPNCGYQFTDTTSGQPTPSRTESRQHIYDNASSGDQPADDGNYNGGNDDQHQQPPHKKHNALIITLIIIIALLVIGGGVAAYKFVLTPGHPNSAILNE